MRRSAAGSAIDERLKKPGAPGLDDGWLADACRALASDTRVRILRVLSERERYCGDLVRLFDLSQSTISHHLKALRESGLVESEEHGVSTCYRVNRDRLRELGDHLARLAAGPGGSKEAQAHGKGSYGSDV